ncbi:MAG: hypothetical protein AAF432_00435 [Planctomycetota bacterium]
MADVHGKNFNAKFNGADICSVESWTVNEGGDTARYATNKSGGIYTRADGLDDYTATINAVQDDTTPLDSILSKGSTGSFEFFENGTLKWAFTGIVESVSVNASPGDMVKYTINVAATAAPTTKPSTS